MSPSLKPKSLLSFLIPISTLSPLNSSWVSHFSTKSLQIHSEAKTHLTFLFNSMRIQDTNRKPKAGKYDHEQEIVCALKSCSSLKAIFQGQQIHAFVSKNGLDSNIFIQNSLLSMYAKCDELGVARKLFSSCSRFDFVSCNIMLGVYVRSGQMDDARRMFDELPDKGVVAYTTMIMGLARNDKWSGAIAVFRDMRVAGVVPNEVTMASVISSYVRVGGILDVGLLHGLTTKLGLRDFVLVSTNLLHMYCACSSLGNARRLFTEMPEKNVVSWNVMLNGYVKQKLVDLAKSIFDEMPGKDVVSWGTIIDAYVQVDRLADALMLYRAMLCERLRSNDVMIVDLVTACGRVMAILEGQQLHATIVKAGFDRYDFIQSTIIHFYSSCGKINLACIQFNVSDKTHLASWNTLISGYIRNGMIEQARIYFDKMPGRDVFSWSSMISGYSQTGNASMALELFRGMVAAGVQPNEITMVSVLSAIASLGVLKDANWAHEYINHNSIPLNNNLIAALIDVYAKCGSISNALDTFKSKRQKITSISPWNAIICGLAMHGHATLCLTKFEELEKTGIKPNSITFIGVLTACCHAGLVQPGEDYFERMKTVYKIDPNIKHYGCMVDLLGRAGRVKEADDLIRSMPMEADVVIWGTLLAACRTHGEVDIGERAANRLAALDTDHGASRVLLSNLYADSGRWEDAIEVRKAMLDQEMTRLPGASGVV
ncbi:pentatricopeptide repeat-containing protein At5g19020, mitochondrial [Silene latifolia]|uniref:pentatricopeptide repeat-containing protein At5g19020, mitochondrial n=1 Tax=Silene latifolia TaxID=37657 RepID=UPI003D789DF7